MPTSIQEYRKNLLGGDFFLTQYSVQLRDLRNNPDFMKFVSEIASMAQVANMDIKAENNLAKKTFYEKQAYYNFPSYKHIADRVKEQGYAKNSAAISAYCVMRMFQEGADLDSIMGTGGKALTPQVPAEEYIPNDDEDAERWNEICFLVNRYRTPNASERDFQIEAENVFEKLGWSRYRGEIATQVMIPVGSSRNVYADIVLCDNNTNSVVVELKKPDAGISERNVDQLFSYMRLLKLDYGILIGDTIKFFYDDPENPEPPVQVVEIPFIANSADGVDFCRAISHDAFSKDRLDGFVQTLSKRASLNEQSTRLLKLITSSEGVTLVRQAMFQFFCEKYSPDVVNKVLDEIRVDIAVGKDSLCGSGAGVDKDGDEKAVSGFNVECTYAPHAHRGNGIGNTSNANSDPESLSTPANNDEFNGMKIGQIANEILRGMLEQDAASAEEISDMQTAGFSKTAFDLNYPLLVATDSTYPHERYYSKPLMIKGREYKLCSQWFEGASNNDRPYLVQWIREHGKNQQ